MNEYSTNMNKLTLYTGHDEEISFYAPVFLTRRSQESSEVHMKTSYLQYCYVHVASKFSPIRRPQSRENISHFLLRKARVHQMTIDILTLLPLAWATP